MRKIYLCLLVLIVLLPVAALAEQKDQVQKAQQEKLEKLCADATALYQEQKYKEASELYQQAGKLQYTRKDDVTEAFYNLACCYALLDEKPKTIDSLAKAIKNGFDDLDRITDEKAFETIKDNEKFKALLEKLPKPIVVSDIKVTKTKKLEKDLANDPWEEAYELETEHFRIALDLPEKDGIALAQQMEYLLETICRVFKFDKALWKKVKRNCYLFKDLEHFKNIRDKTNGDKGAAGGYVGGETLVACSTVHGYGFLDLIPLHESTHLIMNVMLAGGNRGINKNFWAVEAIAVYMGSMKDEGNNKFSFGNAPLWELKKVFKERGNEVADLIDWDKQTLYSGANKSNAFILSYGVCHYLFNAERKRYRNSFCEYIKLVYKKATIDKSFEDMVGITPKELQEKVTAHIDSLK
ncbi:MAG: hypothetical protein HY811_02265 [Planctomycetes bacterium]|nr:hypothetical protein [Planctomycetota bacterium]